MDLEDADPLPGDHDADDAVARYSATRLEADRQVVVDAADSKAAGGSGAFGLGVAAELEAHHPVDIEPAVLTTGAAKAARAPVGRLLRLMLDRVRDRRLEDVIDRELIAPDGGERILERLVAQPWKRLLQRLVRELLAEALEVRGKE